MIFTFNKYLFIVFIILFNSAPIKCQTFEFKDRYRKVIIIDTNGYSEQCTSSSSINLSRDSCSNKYLYFDGVNDRINIPNQYTGNVEFTIECWLKSDNILDGGPDNFHRILTIGGSPRLEIGDQRGEIILYNGSFFKIPGNIRDDNWHHLVISRGNGFLKIYFDGILKTQNIVSNVIDLRNLRVGYFDNNVNNLQPPTLWKGGIDEIKLWNYALSTEEILYSKNKISSIKKDCGLIGYWRMEDGIHGQNNDSITTIKDSIKENHGVLVGFNLVGDTSNFVCNKGIQFSNDSILCCKNLKPKFTFCPDSVINYVNKECISQFSVNYPIATDPCTNMDAEVQYFRSDNQVLSMPYPVGKTKVTCVSLSKNMLRDTCVFSVIVRDTIKPVCKTQNISIYLNSSGSTTILPSSINNGSSDACSEITLNIEGQQTFQCNTLGEQTIYLVVTDDSKNVSICSAEVTVLDSIKPTCVIQPEIFFLDADGQISVSQDLLHIISSDNCAGSVSTINKVNFYCTDLGYKTISATTLDVSGNTNTCTTEITIRDTIRPTCNIAPKTIYLGPSGQTTLSQEQLNITAIDNCPGVTTTFNSIIYDCTDIGNKVAYATVQDDSGNINTCSVQITIRDTIRPLCIIRDTIVSATDGLGVLVNFSGTAFDNCGVPAITYSPPSGQVYTCGDYNISMNARDGSGNTNTCSFKLTVKDCGGCCLSENTFLTNTNVDFNLSSDLLSKDECVVQFITPKLTECQRVTEISWGDGTISRGSFTNAVDFTHQFTDPAIYEVCVTYEEANQNECFKNKKCNTFEVLENCTLIRSAGHLDYDKIILVPNPAHESFGISGGEIFTDYAIYDQLGKEMVDKRKVESTNDIAQLQNGVYFVKLFVGSIIVTKTIIKIQ